MNRSDIINTLIERADAGRTKAKAEGYEPSSGTYTFTNKEAAVVSAALGSVSLLLKGEVTGSMLLLTALKSGRQEAIGILARIAKDIQNKQCPAYINDAVETTLAEVREIDPSN